MNSLNAKKIILYLAKYSDREFTRDEIRQNLKLDLSDDELEQKRRAPAEMTLSTGCHDVRFRSRVLHEKIVAKPLSDS